MKIALISILIAWAVIAFAATLSLLKAASKSTVKDPNNTNGAGTERKSPNSNPHSSKNFQNAG